MNISLANQTKHFTPNFKGNLIPEMAMNDGDGFVLHCEFDKKSHGGDSFELAKTLAKDLDTKDIVSPKSSQKIHHNGKCIFDSSKSSLALYADADGKNVIMNLGTDDDMYEHFLSKNSDELKETTITIRKFLDNIIMNLDNKLHQGYANKDELFETCINLLKKLKT